MTAAPLIARLEDAETQRCLERLNTMKTWGANWDAEGAYAPDLGAIAVAEEFLQALGGPMSVLLSATGEPMLFLDGGVELTFSADGSVSFWSNGLQAAALLRARPTATHPNEGDERG